MSALIETPTYIVDVETTGLDPSAHTLCEIAAVRWHPSLVSTVPAEAIWSTLVHPGRAIPRAATAIHGIRDKDVRHAPTVAEAIELFERVVPSDSLIIAHNLPFDSGFLPLGGRRGACTLRLARATWPEAPSHANAILAAWLGVDTSAFRAHRAAADALVTLSIFNLYLREMQRRHGRFPTVGEIARTIRRRQSSRATSDNSTAFS